MYEYVTHVDYVPCDSYILLGLKRINISSFDYYLKVSYESKSLFNFNGVRDNI